MKNIIIFGYGMEGVHAWMQFERNGWGYNLLGFADNALVKQGKMAFGTQIKSLDDLEALNEKMSFSVIIASSGWRSITAQLEDRQISIEGFMTDNKLVLYSNVARFENLDCTKPIFLYAGDIPSMKQYMDNVNLFGLSITKWDEKHIYHDITAKYPLPDESICAYEAEDVLEHIDVKKVVPAVNEIYRILKKGGILRICLPDYNSPLLNRISLKDNNGEIIYEPTGGGRLGLFGVENGGHLWFPTYERVFELLKETLFEKIDFLCYYTAKGKLIKREFDYTNGYVNRIDNIADGEIFTMVIDCEK